MPIALSPEAQAKAAQIPDIAARLERFIDEQYALEQWRAKRRRPEVAELVQEAVAEGIALKGVRWRPGCLVRAFVDPHRKQVSMVHSPDECRVVANCNVIIAVSVLPTPRVRIVKSSNVGDWGSSIFSIRLTHWQSMPRNCWPWMSPGRTSLPFSLW